MEFSPLILAHIFTASTALVVGAAVLALKKGTSPHRIAGRLWVGLMVSTALMSFGIKSSGDFSPIHILSVITLVGVAAAVFAAVRGKVSAHRRGMLATYAGLAIAGGFALLPGRLLGDLLWNAVGFV